MTSTPPPAIELADLPVVAMNANALTEVLNTRLQGWQVLYVKCDTGFSHGQDHGFAAMSEPVCVAQRGYPKRGYLYIPVAGGHSVPVGPLEVGGQEHLAHIAAEPHWVKINYPYLWGRDEVRWIYLTLIPRSRLDAR